MSITPSLSEHLRQIIEPLRRAVAAHGGTHRADVPLVVLLWSYLHRVAKRFESLTARLAQGRPIVPRPPRVDRPASASPSVPRPRLPQRFGYLAKFGWNFRNYASQLRHLIATPEMRELLEASPQAAKLLRPLCRMLAIEPAPDLPQALFVPPRPRPPAATQSRPPATPQSRQPAAPAPDAPKPWRWPKPA